MKCYHMTTLDRLESINKMDLVPRNERNSKLINDDKVKVFFSEGYEGAIALFVDFNIVYNKIKNKEDKSNDEALNNIIINSNNLEDYLGKGVYLCFDMNNIQNERNFENGATSEIIEQNKLKVVLLKNKDKIIYSRFDVIMYMMSKVAPEDIKYYGEDYPESPDFDIATENIQNKVRQYYKENEFKIKKYNDYEIIEISLDNFLKEGII